MALFTPQQAEEITSWIEWIPGLTVTQRDSIENTLRTANGNVRSIFNKVGRDDPIASEMILDFIDELDAKSDDIVQFLQGLDVRIRGKYT